MASAVIDVAIVPQSIYHEILKKRKKRRKRTRTMSKTKQRYFVNCSTTRWMAFDGTTFTQIPHHTVPVVCLSITYHNHSCTAIR